MEAPLASRVNEELTTKEGREKRWQRVRPWDAQRATADEERSAAAMRVGARSRPVVPGLAALFLNEMNSIDTYAALGGLDHVVDG